MILKNFKDFLATLESLPISYLEELLHLIDYYEFNNKKDIVDMLYKELLNHSRLKNYFLLLDDTQKLAVSETVHNLNGKYNEDYFLGKHGVKPLFEREKKIFMQVGSPTFINLFIYSKSFIPKELMFLLKEIVPKPPVWEIESFKYDELNISKEYKTDSFIRDIWYLLQFETVILTNRKKISKKSNDLLLSIYKDVNVNSLLELFINSNLIIVLENKLRNNYSHCSYNHFLDILLNSFYEKDSLNDEEVDYKKDIINGLKSFSEIEWTSIQTFYSFLEIEYFSSYQKNILLKKRTKKIDILTDAFKNYLYFLEIVELIQTKEDLFFKLTEKGKLFLENSLVPLEKKSKIKVMPNFEILILSHLDPIENLYLESFTEEVSINVVRIIKKKLLKAITMGILIDDLILFLGNLSSEELPESIVLFFKETKKKILYIKDEILLNADSFLVNILTHDKKVSKFFTIDEEKLKIKVSNRKITTVLASLDYPVIIQ